MSQQEINKQISERLERLEKAIFGKLRNKHSRKITQFADSAIQISFNINSRAFFKKYAKGMTGARKFVLVVSFLSKGRTDKDVTFDEIERVWNRHSGLLGGKLHSGIYGTRAKEKEWLDSPKHGVYGLNSRWKEIFAAKGR